MKDRSSEGKKQKSKNFLKLLEDETRRANFLRADTVHN